MQDQLDKVCSSNVLQFGRFLTKMCPLGRVEGKMIEKGLVSANGINTSLDGKTIYVSEVLRRRIRVFNRNVETGMLAKSNTIKLNTAPDNIDIHENGYLWVAGHSKVLEFLAHAKDENEIAPSHVVKIDPRSGYIKDVMVSTNGEINASSVGAVHDGILLVGAVFESHILICPVSANLS